MSVRGVRDQLQAIRTELNESRKGQGDFTFGLANAEQAIARLSADLAHASDWRDEFEVLVIIEG